MPEIPAQFISTGNKLQMAMLFLSLLEALFDDAFNHAHDAAELEDLQAAKQAIYPARHCLLTNLENRLKAENLQKTV